MITVCILTLSDRGSEGQRQDESGEAIKDMLGKIEAEVKHYELLPDEKKLIKEKLNRYSGLVDLILTTGGTGLSPRDVTPDATLEVIEKEIPGIAEAMRAEGLRKTGRAMLSRAVAGMRKGTLIVNLPGSPKAVRESLGAIINILPHAIDKLRGSDRECAR